ncbi:MAG: DUF29 family protein [Zavarzinia sp.]
MAVTNRSLYDRDFYAWANEQAALLRAGKLDKADIANIAEEIESMGRSENANSSAASPSSSPIS